MAEVVRYAFETTRATIVCPFPRRGDHPRGGRCSQSHALERAKRVIKNDGATREPKARRGRVLQKLRAAALRSGGEGGSVHSTAAARLGQTVRSQEQRIEPPTDDGAARNTSTGLFSGSAEASLSASRLSCPAPSCPARHRPGFVLFRKSREPLDDLRIDDGSSQASAPPGFIEQSGLLVFHCLSSPRPPSGLRRSPPPRSSAVLQRVLDLSRRPALAGGPHAHPPAAPDQLVRSHFVLGFHHRQFGLGLPVERQVEIARKDLPQ